MNRANIRRAVCIMQNIPHSEFLECLIDVGSFRGRLCLVLRCLFELLESLSRSRTASWKVYC